MHIRRFRWRIALPFAILVTIIIAGLSVYIATLLQRIYINELHTRLRIEARLIGSQLNTYLLMPANTALLGAASASQAQTLQARLTIIAPDGTVLADTNEDYRIMVNHLYRPEVQQALAAGDGYAIRYSATLGYQMLYVGVAIPDASAPLAVVRLAVPMSQVDAAITRLSANLVLAALGALLAVYLLAYLVTQRILRPIYRLTDAVNKLSAGDLDVHVLSTEKDEVGRLTNAFNQLADGLRTTISSFERERDRLNALVMHLADGVVILDKAGIVQLVNPAALRLLGYSGPSALGQPLTRISRYAQVTALWYRYQESNQDASDILELAPAGILCQIIFTPLPGGEAGASLMIMQDLTKIRRLETIRRDFISNISHELRTPLASLKLLSETLQEGALDDPPAARRFVERIEGEVDSMTVMVEELLELARIESGLVPFNLVPVQVRDIIAPVLERMQPLAERAGLNLGVEMPADLPLVLADRDRIQRALGNLVHNAIKFTPSGGQVVITAAAAADEVIFTVRDTGVGIPAEMLNRIFERFYTVDKSHSGGTGLGLSIARHIVEVHHGRIWAESTPGKGSSFHFTLPIADQQNPIS
ncbi:MAG: ATP-binding protein [Anaerolineae bacterium]